MAVLLNKITFKDCKYMKMWDKVYKFFKIEDLCLLFKRPARDACLCMGELQAPPAPHFVFLITL